ncbi:hypothetical protein DSAG12_02996 [Promethearchaeum syntrophicum]|uniref:Uncharacterized protein n=1 Tax=Promethearchaeum syntrophicum TaxID=2594042 RepID=A0A5B9DDG4_9ARCH|nr:hypothetical protein [Candidatus Prometheoarchaeum syntrophicum]QEE17164.1 hypothetical protein DSAG12_02996 [Candidatus Prometheoarchaeum syntrophicum]
MKEFNGLFLFAILGLLTAIAFGITMSIYSNFTIFGNFLLIAIFILFFIGLYGIAFMVRKEK